MHRAKAPVNAAASRDPGLTLSPFMVKCLVVCPGCGECAVTFPASSQRRFTCAKCGKTEIVDGQFKPRPIGGKDGNWPLRCTGCGRSFEKRPWRGSLANDRVRKVLRCQGCGRTASYDLWSLPPDVRDGVDPFFGYPLYLSTTVHGRHFWALNEVHLRVLEDYLTADLRKRPLGRAGMTMMARLPRWMKESGNRASVVAALRRLHKLAARAA